VVSEEEQIGVLTINEAIELAADRGLDLIEISPKAKPPVCKIIDYGKFKYQQNKKAKENKKASTKIVVREIRMKVRIGQHDLELKARNAMKFLAAGNKVRVSVMFRAREITHPEIGQELLEKFLEMVKDRCLIEKGIAMEGKTLVTTLAPL
jgi:translation initiation factor IF-3